ncbi:MAG: hypothetical protein ACYDAY_05960 [Candidatus Dormibacteria bacterium]
MRLGNLPRWATFALLAGGVASGITPAHAATSLTIQDSAAVPQYGIDDSANPGCGDLMDPITTRSDQTVTWAAQEPNGGAAPGKFADVKSASITPSTFSSRSPIGAQASSANPSGFAFIAPDASINSGRTDIPGLQITVNLCGALPRDNFATPAVGNGVTYTGAQWYVVFQTPEQENIQQLGFNGTGGPNQDGPYPASSGWYWESNFALTAGNPSVDWGVFDPQGQFVASTVADPDLVDTTASCATSSSGANACLNQGGNFADGLGDKMAAAISDAPDGSCVRCVVSWFMPYQPVTTGSPFAQETVIQPGDVINNVIVHAFASASVPVPQQAHIADGNYDPGPCTGGLPHVGCLDPNCDPNASFDPSKPQDAACTSNQSPDSLGGFLFTTDFAPGNIYCPRLTGGTGPDPTRCAHSTDQAYDLGAAGAPGVKRAIPNPIQNSEHVNSYAYNACQQYDTDQPTSDAYPYGPYPGQTGQTAGGDANTPLCASGAPTRPILSAEPERQVYTEQFNINGAVIGVSAAPLGSIYGRILVPETAHYIPTGLSLIG